MSDIDRRIGMEHDGASRRRFLRATGTVTTLGLAGCLGFGNTGGTNDSSNTVQYLSDRGDSKSIIDKIIADFEKNHDYTVDVTYTSKGVSTNKQLQKMRAAGNLPDVVFDTAADAYRYQRNDNLAPITDTVTESGLPDPVRVDGESYFAATMVEPLMGWYRNDLYKKNPTTWNGWQSAAKQVTQEHDLMGYVVQSGQTNNADTQITQYHWQNDVEIYSGPSSDITVTIDEGKNRKRAIETYEWLETMAQYAPKANGWGWSESIQALQQETTAAIMSVGGLPILTIKENRPDLLKKLSPTAFPVPQDGKQDKWWAYMEGHTVWKEGNATEGAKEFVRYFTESDKFMQFVLSAPLFQFPPTREMLDSKAVKTNSVIQDHPAVMKLVRNNWDSFSSILNTGRDGAPNIIAAEAYGRQLFGQSAGQLLVGGKSPEETVDWIAKKLRSINP
jgi:multiple sugar transport system substrate-binding protein